MRHTDWDVSSIGSFRTSPSQKESHSSQVSGQVFGEKSSEVSTKSLGQRLKVIESSLKSPERSDIILKVSMSSGFC